MFSPNRGRQKFFNISYLSEQGEHFLLGPEYSIQDDLHAGTATTCWSSTEENQCPVPYTGLFLAASSFQYLEIFKRKIKSYLLNHVAREGGEEKSQVSGRQEISSSGVAKSNTNCSMVDCAHSDRRCRAWTQGSVTALML